MFNVIPLVFVVIAGVSVSSSASDYCQNKGHPFEIAGSALDIVNGIETEDYESVIQLDIDGYTCTATAVSDSIVITAEHCVSSSVGKRIGFESARALDFVFSREVDVAVILFPKNTFKIYAQLGSVYPAPGDILTLVGYGQSNYVENNVPDGKKRMGCNRLEGFAVRDTYTITHQETAGDYLHYRSLTKVRAKPGLEAMTGRGDSGGPIFIGDQLIGVVSFGGTRSELRRTHKIENDPEPSKKLIYEYDTNLASPAAQRLLNRAREEFGVNFF
jgi:hypothetical protein